MFELLDSAFQRGSDCLAVAFDDAIDERRHFFLDIDNLTLEHRFAFSAFRPLPLPNVAEDGRRQVEQLASWRQGAQEVHEGALNLVPGYRLALADAAGLTAQVVRIGAELSL